MATLKFNGTTYTVDHAVKGADYINGYAADGTLIVSFRGVIDFSAFTYSGTYMTPDKCLEEPCNGVLQVNGKLVRRDGATIPASAIDAPSLVERGVNIPDYSTLDDYTTPGDYYVLNQANTKTLKNAPPANSGFRLEVKRGNQGTTHIFHTAYASDSRVFKREKFDGKWDDWSMTYDTAHPPAAVDVGARPKDWMPNAAEVGAVALDGSGTMTGDLIIRKENEAPRVILDRGTSGAEVRLSSIDNTAVLQAKEAGATAFRQLRLASTKRSPAGSLKDVLQLYSTVSGEGMKSFLHTGNISEHGVAKIETGSYVGTGTCGPDGPTEISFGFVPKMLWVWDNGNCPIGTHTHGYAIPCTNLTAEYMSVQMLANYANTLRVKLVDNKVSFYSPEGDWDDEDEDLFIYDGYSEQLNRSGTTYYYMAIG